MILLTGGTGLLGSHLLYYLLDENQTIRATHRSGSDMRQLRFIFKQLSAESNSKESWEQRLSRIEWVEAELLDIIALEDALQGIDTVYHAAGMVDFSRKNARHTIKNNVESTANIVNLCVEHNIRKLAYVSSVASIARKHNVIVNEDAKIETMKFASAYSESKYRAEMEVYRGIAEGLDAVLINPAVILGYGDYNKSSLTIVKQIAKGMPVYPCGSNAYVDARDVAKALIELAKKPESSGKRYIAIGANLSYKELFTGLATCLGKKSPYIEAGPVLCNAAWMGTGLLALLTGSRASITRDLARTAIHKFGYNSVRLQQEIGFTFTPIQKTIEDSCKGYKAWIQENP
jgi:dihydroflavonol-4-reductase